jgi:hypothetical protein
MPEKTSIPGVRTRTPETKTSDPNVRELQSLVSTPDFKRQFLIIQTRAERDTKERLLKEVAVEAEKRLEPFKRSAALKILGVTTPVQEKSVDANTMRDAYKAVQDVDIEISGTKTLVDISIARNILMEKLKKEEYAAALAEVEQNLEQAIALQAEILNHLQEELKEPSVAFIKALQKWGRSENLKGERGPNGKGFNAGAVHYFEYRASLDKNRNRFKPKDTLDAAGFTAYTRNIEIFVQNPSPRTNPGVEKARLLEDAKGNRRLYILTKDKEFIVAFQRAGEPIKILSAFLGQNIGNLNKVVHKELAESVDRFNRLEGPVREIPL